MSSDAAAPSPLTLRLLQYLVYALLAAGVLSCVAVGANRPADPRLVQVPEAPPVSAP